MEEAGIVKRVIFISSSGKAFALPQDLVDQAWYVSAYRATTQPLLSAKYVSPLEDVTMLIEQLSKRFGTAPARPVQ